MTVVIIGQQPQMPETTFATIMEPSFTHLPVSKRLKMKTAVTDLRKHGYGFIMYEYAYIRSRRTVVLGKVYDVDVHISIDGVARECDAKMIALAMVLGWLFDLPSNLMDLDE